MKKRKALAIFIAISMVLCYMPATALADTVEDTVESTMYATNFKIGLAANAFMDMPEEGFWSTLALEAAVNNNLLNGFTEEGRNYIKPNDSLTRAQIAAVINRAFGAKDLASLSGCNDVPSNEWYYKEMQKAVKMGTIKLDKAIRPNDNITRQEAFTILARALKMRGGNNENFSKFHDASEVKDWAVSGMGSMVKAGFIKGDNNLLNPTANMTRAEFAAVMNNVIKQYIKTPGTVTEIASGNIMVNVAGVTLENATVTGDLIVGDGVANGTVTLNNVLVKGNLIIRSGRLESVVLTDGSFIEGEKICGAPEGNFTYLALGDSIAYGHGASTITSYSDINYRFYKPSVPPGNGYTDMLYSYLNNYRGVGIYINASSNGLTSESLKKNLMKESFTSYLPTDSHDFITISVGGDDILKPLKAFVKKNPAYLVPGYFESQSSNIKNMPPELAGLIAELNSSTTRFNSNWKEIMENLRNNTAATIIVNTVYNPFPVGSDLYDFTEPFLKDVNMSIKGMSKAYDYKIADVKGIFDIQNNSNNILVHDLIELNLALHPNDKGYVVIYSLNEKLVPII